AWPRSSRGEPQGAAVYGSQQTNRGSRCPAILPLAIPTLPGAGYGAVRSLVRTRLPGSRRDNARVRAGVRVGARGKVLRGGLVGTRLAMHSPKYESSVIPRLDP